MPSLPADEASKGIAFRSYVGAMPEVTTDSVASSLSWIAGHATKDAFECISLLCDDAHALIEVCRSIKKNPEKILFRAGEPITLREILRKTRGSERDKFEKQKWREKLKILSREYGLLCNSLYACESFLVMRNCFVHRFGFVEDHDVNDKSRDALVVHYTKNRLVLHTESGQELVESVPFHLKSTATASLEFGIPCTKQIPRGHRIDLSKQEMVDMISFIHFAGIRFIQEIGNRWTLLTGEAARDNEIQ
ncbi:MAG: hypothetical protein RBS39_10495 [Phycisphaerales bacterium]|jgi:hypothetical protein|nr:hypothetical protein [Phycisphaerales bacterium]